MRAREGATGLVISFGKEDKHVLEQGGTLETKLTDKPHQKVIVYVQDIVERSESDIFSEPGLRTISEPPGYENRLIYTVWMDKLVAAKLMSEGSHGCRCLYDRLDMNYWSSG